MTTDGAVLDELLAKVRADNHAWLNGDSGPYEFTDERSTILGPFGGATIGVTAATPGQRRAVAQFESGSGTVELIKRRRIGRRRVDGPHRALHRQVRRPRGALPVGPTSHGGLRTPQWRLGARAPSRRSARRPPPPRRRARDPRLTTPFARLDIVTDGTMNGRTPPPRPRPHAPPRSRRQRITHTYISRGVRSLDCKWTQMETGDIGAGTRPTAIRLRASAGSCAPPYQTPRLTPSSTRGRGRASL